MAVAQVQPHAWHRPIAVIEMSVAIRVNEDAANQDLPGRENPAGDENNGAGRGCRDSFSGIKSTGCDGQILLLAFIGVGAHSHAIEHVRGRAVRNLTEMKT